MYQTSNLTLLVYNKTGERNEETLSPRLDQRHRDGVDLCGSFLLESSSSAREFAGLPLQQLHDADLIVV